MLPDVLNRRQLIALHKKARQAGLDINLYNTLKNRAYELESTLKIIRGPLYEHQSRLEQLRRERSSSSSSRSPSSSPSPSPSPSPERSLPKRGIFPRKDAPEKANSTGSRVNPVWPHKGTRDWSPKTSMNRFFCFVPLFLEEDTLQGVSTCWHLLLKEDAR